MVSGKTPLALRNLLHSPARLAASLAGIVFAVVLVFMQLGFQGALLDSTVEILDQLNGDIVLVSRSRFALSIQERFPRARLQQVLELPEVAAAYPLYMETARAAIKNFLPDYLFPRRIRVLAFGLDDPVFRNAEIERQKEKLRMPRTALADRKSKSYIFGPLETGTETELSGQSLTIVGTFQLGSDFANDGNLILSATNFLEYFPDPSGAGPTAAMIDLGLVPLRPGTDANSVVARLNAILPEDVIAMTRADFIARERAFWNDATPIGPIFLMGIIMGFVVGVVICYQILYSDINQHLPEFATLKAIGYRNRYLVGVVLQEAVYLAVAGFIPGLLISFALYFLVAQQTGLLLRMTLAKIALVISFTVIMCVVSGCLAVRRLFSADPAELFR